MKTAQSHTFKNAVIDTDHMTITEYTKDDSHVFDLLKILGRWNGVENISLTIKKDEEVFE